MASKLILKFILFFLLPLTQGSESVLEFDRNERPIELVKWGWKCESSKCVRRQMDEKTSSSSSSVLSLEGCQSMCGAYGSLWPRPSGLCQLGSKVTPIKLEMDTSKVLTWTVTNPRKYIADSLVADYFSDAVKDFVENVESLWKYGQEVEQPPVETEGVKRLKIAVFIKSDDVTLDFDTDEGYDLEVEENESEVKAKITAPTYYGARHAMETVFQLISYDGDKRRLQIVNSVKVEDDRPKFKYRGLLLDTSRNYFSVESIKRIIKGMSMDKMNVFHWHIIDQQSFPFVSNTQPDLTKFGVYDSKSLYYPNEIASIVEFARRKGVMVIPEFDAPAHASFGWQFGPKKGLGDLIVCQHQDWKLEDGRNLAAEPPTGQLNPLNENVYNILENVYTDMIAAFTPKKSAIPAFHMGGDEVNFECWAEDKNIRSWISNHSANENVGFTDPEKAAFLDLWNVFQSKALNRLKKANDAKGFKSGQILWTSEFTKAEHIKKYLSPEEYTIQVWCSGTDSWISDLLRMGYRLIFSNYDAWYLDCGFGAWIWKGEGKDNNWCSPFKSWKVMYENSPRAIVRELFGVSQQLDKKKEMEANIWGGEAAMWSEQVDEKGAEARIWPRLSAVAERLWSDPEELEGWRKAEQRLLAQRRRMAVVGLNPDAIQPEFCRQNEGWCYDLPRPTTYLNPDDIDWNVPDSEEEKPKQSAEDLLENQKKFNQENVMEIVNDENVQNLDIADPRPTFSPRQLDRINDLSNEGSFTAIWFILCTMTAVIGVYVLRRQICHYILRLGGAKNDLYRRRSTDHLF